MNNVVIANNYMHDMQSSTNASICGSAPPGGAGCVTANIFIDPETMAAFPACRFITTWSRPRVAPAPATGLLTAESQ